MSLHRFRRATPEGAESARAVCRCGLARRVRYTAEAGYVREYGREGAWSAECPDCEAPAEALQERDRGRNVDLLVDDTGTLGGDANPGETTEAGDLR